eukprot:2644321-Rhodomonas_salina.2
MALTGEVELGVKEKVESPFAFHSNLTEGLRVNKDSSDVHYFVVDSGRNMIFVSNSALLHDPVQSNVTETSLGPEPLLAESNGQQIGYLQDENCQGHGMPGAGTYIPGTQT